MTKSLLAVAAMSAANSIYQEAAAGSSPAFNWDFLLFGADGGPLADVELVQSGDAGGDIVQNGDVIGTFTIDAPDGATGQSVSGGPSVAIDAPVSGLPTGRLKATFTTGDAAGTYATTLELDGGTSQTMFVTVPE